MIKPFKGLADPSYSIFAQDDAPGKTSRPSQGIRFTRLQTGIASLANIAVFVLNSSIEN